MTRKRLREFPGSDSFKWSALLIIVDEVSEAFGDSGNDMLSLLVHLLGSFLFDHGLISSVYLRISADHLNNDIVVAHILLHCFVRALLLERVAIIGALCTGHEVPFGRKWGLLGEAAPLTLMSLFVGSKSITRFRLVHINCLAFS